jgi:gluconolactonase
VASGADAEARNGGEQHAVGHGFTEGPVVLPGGSVLFTSMKGAIHSLSEGAVRAVAETGNGPTGLALGSDGQVYVAACAGLWGAPAEAPAGIHKLHDDHTHALVTDGLTAPNDLAFGPDGRLYITDPIDEAGLSEPVPGRLFAYDLEQERLELLHEGGHFTNGLAFDPAGKSLYVSETFDGRIVRYPWSSNGLGEPVVHCETVDGTPDGMALDVDGNIWQAVNGSDSIQVFDPSGKLVRRLPTGEGSYPSNCCFGGPDRSTLFVTTAKSGGIASFDVGVQGLALFPFRD